MRLPFLPDLPSWLPCLFLEQISIDLSIAQAASSSFTWLRRWNCPVQRPEIQSPKVGRSAGERNPPLRNSGWRPWKQSMGVARSQAVLRRLSRWCLGTIFPQLFDDYSCPDHVTNITLLWNLSSSSSSVWWPRTGCSALSSVFPLMLPAVCICAHSSSCKVSPIYFFHYVSKLINPNHCVSVILPIAICIVFS